jgi:hypothetical protein
MDDFEKCIRVQILLHYGLGESEIVNMFLYPDRRVLANRMKIQPAGDK